MASEAHLSSIDLMAWSEAPEHHEAANGGSEALGTGSLLEVFAAISYRLFVWDGVQAGLKLTVKPRKALNAWALQLPSAEMTAGLRSAGDGT